MKTTDSSGSPGAAPTGEVVAGRFRIERPLGSGGMGEVLLAHDLLLSRRVALKRLTTPGIGGPDAILKEARRAGRLTDPHIAAVHDVLETDGGVVLVMEYVEGQTLRQRMASPVSLEEFHAIARQSAEGIAAAHAQGLIHRDLKPENLMLTREGRLKILDFGVAKRAEGWVGGMSTFGESAASIAGTPTYMAPEAHLGETVDARADLFSLGVVFYELLTGTHPFQGATYAAVLGKILHATPAPVDTLNPRAGQALSAIVLDLLAKDPAKRVPTARELVMRLAAAERGEVASSARPARARDATPRTRRGAIVAGVAAALVAVTLLMWNTTLRPALPRDRHLAVLAPAVTGSPEFQAFGRGAVEILAGRLDRHAATPGFQLASFTEGFNDRVASAADARKVQGATLALVSVLAEEPDRLHARLELFDTVEEKRIARRTISTSATQPFVFLDRVYREAATMSGLVPIDRGASEHLGIHGAGTLRFHAQALGRMRAAETEDDAQRAVADGEAACRLEPGSPAPWSGLAAAELKMHLRGGGPEWLERAVASARRAVEIDDRRPEGHRVLGLSLARQRDLEGALREMALAYERDPDDPEACRALGRAYARLGHGVKEKETYLAATRRWPHAAGPWWWLGQTCFDAGDFDGAIQAYREMVRRAPLLHRGYANLGGLLVQSGRYADAIDTLRRAIDLLPSKGAFDNLGTAYFNSRRPPEAVAAYNQAFQFGDAEYRTWLNLGDATFWLLHREDQAREAYRQAVRLGREEMRSRAHKGRTFDVTIPADLATVFPKLGQPDSARLYLATALLADSTHPSVAYAAALTLWQLDDRPRAMRWLSLSVRGGYPKAWLRDSPIFDGWRGLPDFQALVGSTRPRAAAMAVPRSQRTRRGSGS